MGATKTRLLLRDLSGRSIPRHVVRVPVRVEGLWQLGEWVNLRAFGKDNKVVRRVPLWILEPEPTPRDDESPREWARALGQWVLRQPPLRRLGLRLDRYLKQCRQCGRWFVDLTGRKEYCSRTCVDRSWNRARRRAANHEQYKRGKRKRATRPAGRR